MNKISIRNTILGFPVEALIVGFLLSLLSGVIVVGLTLTLVLSLVYKKYFLSEYDLELDYKLGAPVTSQILIKGSPVDIKDKIELLITENKLIIIHCPKNSILRLAFKQYITGKAGFLEFIDSEGLAVDSKPLNDRVFILSYRDKGSLQTAMASLIQRGGWAIQGIQSYESTLIDRVYTQTMVFNPKFFIEE